MAKTPKPPEKQTVDLGKGFDNMSTQMRLGMIFIPKVAIIQQPEIVLHVMGNIIPTNIQVFGEYGDHLLYTGVSAQFDSVADNNPALPYDTYVTADGDVKFVKCVGNSPKFTLTTKEDFDELENQSTTEQ